MVKKSITIDEHEEDDDLVVIGGYDGSISATHLRLSKHRSCWVHALASEYAKRTKFTKEEAEEFRSFVLNSLCVLDPLTARKKRSPRRFKNRISVPGIEEPGVVTEVAEESGKVDSGTFDCYFEKIWESLSEEKKTLFVCLDHMYFHLYVQGSWKDKVLSWIKKKNIFSKNYVLVPIVCWGHWNLLVLCHLGASLSSKTRRPCMLLLDSLEIAEPRRFEPNIRKLVFDIYRYEGRTEDKKKIYEIPLLIPKVPQQRDDKECGKYVLYYMALFMEKAPRDFSMEEYPYFMKRDWFNPESLDGFFENLGPVKK